MNIPDTHTLDSLQIPYKLCKVDNCAIRFKVKRYGAGISKMALITKQCPHKKICEIILGDVSALHFIAQEPIMNPVNGINWLETTEFYLSWFNGMYSVGCVNSEPFLQQIDKNKYNLTIGFVKFYTVNGSTRSDWMFEKAPVYARPPKLIKVQGGELKWIRMSENVLPTNAMIGGFEDEIIYISRAHHRGSLCPGKYVPSTHSSYVAWGHSEHSKEEFEILCGYDAAWVTCAGNKIPENAFIAGVSEVENQPLYIGRAMVNGKLICGKVHLLYKACFIPSDGLEVERYTYEILTCPYKKINAVVSSNCICNTI